MFKNLEFKNLDFFQESIESWTFLTSDSNLNFSIFRGLASRGSFTADVASAQTGALINKTICCKFEFSIIPHKIQTFIQFSAMLAPFQITFISDEYEFVPESIKNPNGFQLAYILTACS